MTHTPDATSLQSQQLAILKQRPFSPFSPEQGSNPGRSVEGRASQPARLQGRHNTHPFAHLLIKAYLPSCLPTYLVAYRTTDLPTRLPDPPTCIITYLHIPLSSSTIHICISNTGNIVTIMVVARRGSNPGRLGESQASLPTRLQERCPLHCLGQFAQIGIMVIFIISQEFVILLMLLVAYYQ